MSGLPSQRMYNQQPPSAEEALATLMNRSMAPPVTAIPSETEAEADTQPPEEAEAAEGLSLLDLHPHDTADAAPRLPAARARTPQISFRELYSSPENQVFKVVFFPDRIFHAQYLNASRVPHRYRYSVSDARSVLDATVLKAQVFMDGQKAANLLRVEYRASRLMELSRESGRFMREHLIAWVRLTGRLPKLDHAGKQMVDANGEFVTEEVIVDHPIKLQYCPWIDAYQAEVWDTLEPPSRHQRHDFQVTAQMGPTSPITRVRKFSPLLEKIEALSTVELAFRENDTYEPYGLPILKPNWDNNYERSYQVPNSSVPNSHDKNTVPVNNYYISFQKGWFLDSEDVKPVRYRNAMMDQDNPDYRVTPQGDHPAMWEGETPPAAFAEANVIEMRWLLQREFGGSVVFFHEVTIPPGTVEGTHQHIGSEELYYVVSGKGVAYMAEGDDPKTAGFKKVTRRIYGLFDQECVELPVEPGNVIFTKSGGIHGIKNTGVEPLKFVAFLYHSV